ncbi:MAG: hypothetical protein G01um101430_680 [Parcubacteria group bacterium Gr01-1014_30]|nr:MAG: hypothetical protein G01um101430_680 [Parcubacteria group bacterium Gr01-1014_30]
MTQNINRKIIFAALILILVLLFSFYLYRFFNPSEPALSFQIDGRIEEVKDGFVIVSGTVKSLDPDDLRRESKSIEFEITPQTVFKTNTLVITAEQLQSGETFSPETKQKSGDASALTDNMVVQVWSKDDLFTIKKATAVELHYISYDISYPAQ